MASALELALLRGGLPGQTLAETVGGINVGLEGRRREGLAASMVADLLSGEDDPQLQAMGQAIRENPFAARQMLQTAGPATQLIGAFEARRANRAATDAARAAQERAPLIAAILAQAPNEQSAAAGLAAIGVEPERIASLAGTVGDVWGAPQPIPGTPGAIGQQNQDGQWRTLTPGIQQTQEVPIEAGQTVADRFLNTISGANQFVRGARALQGTIRGRPDLLGAAGGLASLRNAVGQTFAGLTGSVDSEQRGRIQETDAFKSLGTGQQADVVRAMLLDLAIARARATQPGVLTDQDILQQMRIIGGQVGGLGPGSDPDVLIANLDRLIDETLSDVRAQQRALQVSDEEAQPLFGDELQAEFQRQTQPPVAGPAALPEGATIRTDPESGRRFWFTGTPDAPTDSDWID